MKNFTLISVFALILSAPTQAETINCTAIISLPYTIATQGAYCLTGHLSTSMASGNAITINANNVVLDLNGFKLGGQAAGLGTTANGIYAYQRQNITIRNGTVRGFYRGIHLSDTTPYNTSQGHVIEDIRVDQNTFMGISAYGSGNMIRNNQLVATGGTTTSANAYAYGIGTVGAATQVLNNLVTEVTAQGTGEAYGIEMYNASNSVVAGNRVSNIASLSGGTIGIFLNSGTNLAVRDNIVTTVLNGIYFNPGVTGTYMGNLVRSTSSPYTGGTAAGTTNY